MNIALHIIMVFVTLALFSGVANTQSYPTKPIRFVVPYPPGGSNDILTRVVANAMSPGLGKPIIIDNRGGAGGMVGADNVAKSSPDGYSILNVQASFTAQPAVRSKLPYDPINDFAYIGMMARGPLVLVAHPSMPVKNAKELIQYAKERPGQITYATTGKGSHNHLAMELLCKMAGINMLHVAYKGAAPAMNETMGGHVQMFITSLPSVMSPVQSGRLKVLAIGSAERSSLLPEIATFNESSVPGFVAEFWWGLAAPAKTPVVILNRLAAELSKALKSEDLKRHIAGEGAEPAGMTREEFTKFIVNEITRWRKAARDANISEDQG